MTEETHQECGTFLLEEFKSLREEMLQVRDRKDKNERLAFGALILIYGFLFSSEYAVDQKVSDLIWFLPPIVSVAFMRRGITSQRKTVQIGQYIRERIEPVLGPSGGAWEARLEIIRKSQSTFPSWGFGFGRIWLVIFIASLAAAVLKLAGYH